MENKILWRFLQSYSQSQSTTLHQNFTNQQSIQKQGLFTSKKKKARYNRFEPILQRLLAKENPYNTQFKLHEIPGFDVQASPSTIGYQGRSTYTLGAVNSIAIQNNLIYDLLDPQLSTSISSVKCNCFQSKCQARYCQCFARGNTCGHNCSCVNCQNVEESNLNFKQKKEWKGCHCKKSNCQKKYCECHKEGKRCGELCKCQDCYNV